MTNCKHDHDSLYIGANDKVFCSNCTKKWLPETKKCEEKCRKCSKGGDYCDGYIPGSCSCPCHQKEEKGCSKCPSFHTDEKPVCPCDCHKAPKPECVCHGWPCGTCGPEPKVDGETTTTSSTHTGVKYVHAQRDYYTKSEIAAKLSVLVDELVESQSKVKAEEKMFRTELLDYIGLPNFAPFKGENHLPSSKVEKIYESLKKKFL